MGNSHYVELLKGRMTVGGTPWHLLCSFLLISVPYAIWFPLGIALPLTQPWTLSLFVLKCVSAVLHLLALVLLFRTALTDPGFIPPPASPEQSFGVVQSVDMGGIYMTMKYCGRCSMLRPLRTQHCSDCDACCQRFDHHCPWTGTCIGRRNYHCFVLMMEWLTAALALSTAVAGAIVVYSLVAAPSLETLQHLPADILVLLDSGFFLGYVAQIVHFHTAVLIPRSLTTFEMLVQLFADRPTFFSLSAPVGRLSFRLMRHRCPSLVRLQRCSIDRGFAPSAIAASALWETAPDMLGPRLLPELAERIAAQRVPPVPFSGSGLSTDTYSDLRLQSGGYIVNVPLVATALNGEAAGPDSMASVGLVSPLPSCWQVESGSMESFVPQVQYQLSHGVFIRVRGSGGPERRRCVWGRRARKAHTRYLRAALRGRMRQESVLL